MFSPFQVSPLETFYRISPPLASMRVFSPTHPLQSSRPSIPLHWVIKHPQAQGPLLPLMSIKAILCHICCCQTHGSFRVNSLVGSPVPRSYRVPPC